MKQDFLDTLIDQDPRAREASERLRPRYEFLIAVVNRRKELGWSQRDLAAAIGVSQPVIARLESGDHDPRLGTIYAVCTALGLPLVVGDRTMVEAGDPAPRRSA